VASPLTDPQTLTLVTSSANKVAEATRLLGIPLRQLAIDLTETQAATLEEITCHKLARARAAHGPGRVIVEDVSLGLDELGGFPGPYVRWLIESAGGAGLAAIARGLGDRAAHARCCLAYWDGYGTRLFQGVTPGEVLVTPRGAQTFGWDAWFEPEGSPKSFGEMTPEEKDRVSHRAKAYRQLAAFLRGDAVLA